MDFYYSYKGRHSWCKACCSERAAERYKENPLAFKERKIKSRSDVRKRLLEAAQARAALKRMSLDITLDDIEVPQYCPVLGMALQINTRKAQDNSPSLDRIDSSLGYVKGNVQVISKKANVMKSNASREELLKFANWIISTND